MSPAKAKTVVQKKRRLSTRPRRLPKGPNGGIQLLLIHPVEDLGERGEVVEVKPGLASNYLLPQGLATVATDHHQRMVEKHRVKIESIQKARLNDLKSYAKALGEQSITIEANANDDGHLYGSVGANEISAALKQQECDIKSDQILLEGPLKELGLYTVKIKLHAEVEAEIKVWLVPSVTTKGDQV